MSSATDPTQGAGAASPSSKTLVDETVLRDLRRLASTTSSAPSLTTTAEPPRGPDLRDTGPRRPEASAKPTGNSPAQSARRYFSDVLKDIDQVETQVKSAIEEYRPAVKPAPAKPVAPPSPPKSQAPLSQAPLSPPQAASSPPAAAPRPAAAANPRATIVPPMFPAAGPAPSAAAVAPSAASVASPVAASAAKPVVVQVDPTIELLAERHSEVAHAAFRRDLRCSLAFGVSSLGLLATSPPTSSGLYLAAACSTALSAILFLRAVRAPKS